jgi:hypothetical protein
MCLKLLICPRTNAPASYTRSLYALSTSFPAVHAEFAPVTRNTGARSITVPFARFRGALRYHAITQHAAHVFCIGS